MKNTVYILSAVIILASCSKGGGDKISEKRAELTKLQADEKVIAASIKKLQAELDILEPKKEIEKVVAVTVSPIAAQTFKHFVEIQGQSHTLFKRDF